MNPAETNSPLSDRVELLAGAARQKSLPGVWWRAIRLRCPVCGQGKLFRGWFRMHENCPECGFHFERGPGYWLGSIYVNYGLTAVLVTAGYFALFFADIWSPNTMLISLTAFCFVFPLFYFRFARSLWIGFDVYFDPPSLKEFHRAENAAFVENAPPVAEPKLETER
ncbi:MAG TPA: DUF983 domain-containing protein [Pirellulales bacterium]|jgi:uncharacterized protein (DUF983 family)